MIDSGSNNQSQTKYLRKKIGASVSVKPNSPDTSLVKLLELLSTVKNNQQIPSDFFHIFETFKNTRSQQLRYSNKSPSELDKNKENLQNYFLAVDAGFLFYDLIKTLKIGLGGNKDLDTTLDDSEILINKPKTKSALQNGLGACRGNDKASEISLLAADQINNAYSASEINTLALFFLELLYPQTQDDSDDESKNQEDSSGSSGGNKGSGSSLKSSGKKIAEDGDTDGTETSQDSTQSPTQIEQDRRINILHDPEFRREAIRFASITLIQMENLYGLPEGSLMGSDPESMQLRGLLTEKSISYLLTSLTPEKLQEFIKKPATRLSLVQDFSLFVKNDPKTMILLGERITQEIKANPKLVEEIQENLKEGSGKQTELNQKILEELEKKDESGKSFFENLQQKSEKDGGSALSNSSITNSAQKELLDHLRKKINNEKDVSLARININETINAMISLSLPTEIMNHLSAKSFEKIFGRDIPYDPETLEAIKDLWTTQRSSLSRKFGFHLNTEALAATREALESLRKNDPYFIDAIAERVDGVRKNTKDNGISTEDLIGIQHQNPSLSQKTKTYYNQIWQEAPHEERLEYLLSHGANLVQAQEYAVLETYTIQVSYGLTLHQTAIRVSGYGPTNQTGFTQDPVAQAYQYGQDREFSKKTRGGAREKQGWKERFGALRKKLGPEANKQIDAAKEKLVDGLSKIAEKAATSAYGPIAGKVAGWLVKTLADKEKRKKLFLAIGAGIGGVIAGLIALFKKSLVLGSTAVVTAVAWALGGPVAGLVAGGITYLVGKFFESGGTTSALLSQGAQSGVGVTSATGVSAQAQTAGTSAVVQTTVAKSFATTIATQSVGGTFGTLALGTVLTYAALNSAFLADFSYVDPLSTIDIEGKQSKYVTVEKRAFATGCNDNKCENPSFPLRVEYSVIIKPKGDYTVQTKSIVDELKVNHNSEAWGGSPPNVDPGDTNLSEYEDRIIGPGESLEISYTKVFDENYNNASIINTFDLELYFTDPTTGEEGVDHAITGEVIYIGEYSQGEGCWPVSGVVTQLPGGDWSHGASDAYDIAGSLGTPVYAPFAGSLNQASVDPGYGNHVILTSSEGTFLFGHLSSISFSGSKDVSAGFILGRMGSTGNSTGSHLHVEIQCNNRWFGCSNISLSSSVLAKLMPDGTAIRKNNLVRSCYD